MPDPRLSGECAEENYSWTSAAAGGEINTHVSVHM